MSLRDEVLSGLPDGRLLIGGERVGGMAGDRMSVTDPARGEAVAEVCAAREEDVARAVDAARAAFDSGPWPGLDARDRGHLLRRLASRVKACAEELAGLETLNTGKPFEQARRGDVAQTIDTLTYFAGFADKLEGRTVPVRGERLAYTLREPVGVVGAVIPWNFPLLLAAWKLGPALAAGCTLVLKPAEETPLTALRLADLVEEAGLPPGVVNVVPGDGPRTGRTLVEHPGVDKVAFTGSTETGREVLVRAAPTLKRVSLELGGKSPVLVFEDAGDLQRVARGVAAGAYFNQGACCTAGARILVARSLHDDLLARLVEEARGLCVGDPFDRRTGMGPLISRAHREQVHGHVTRAVDAGARLAAGGADLDVDGLEGGCFYRPTVLKDARPDAAVAREEIFGPVAVVLPFDGEEEAVALANDNPYGLAAGLWTRDAARAHRVARRLRCGTVWVNGYNRFDAGCPFGGVKASGFGRENGAAALEPYTAEKSVWVDLRGS